MGTKSQISWTDSTWNPIRGCTVVSPGCDNCYAMRMAARFSGKGEPYDGLAKMTDKGPKWTGKLAFIENHLKDPMKWQGNRRIFVNSMSDLFHQNAAPEWIHKIFAVMAACQNHQFQVLTKRHNKMATYTTFPDTRETVSAWLAWLMCGVKPEIVPQHLQVKWPLPNVWLGVSAESQGAYNKQIDGLMQSEAAVRFLSLEPLIGPIDAQFEHMSEKPDWVIVGAESGPGRRPMDEGWVRDIRDQCKNAGIAFFYKQKIEGGKKVETPTIDGEKWVEFPDTHEPKVKIKNIIL
jgi:protein gp37